MIGDQVINYSSRSNSNVNETIELLTGNVPEGAPQLQEPEEGKQPELGVPEVKTVP
jgi:hypothetical protein